MQCWADTFVDAPVPSCIYLLVSLSFWCLVACVYVCGVLPVLPAWQLGLSSTTSRCGRQTTGSPRRTAWPAVLHPVASLHHLWPSGSPSLAARSAANSRLAMPGHRASCPRWVSRLSCRGCPSVSLEFQGAGFWPAGKSLAGPTTVCSVRALAASIPAWPS